MRNAARTAGLVWCSVPRSGGGEPGGLVGVAAVQGEVGEADRDQVAAVQPVATHSDDVQRVQVVPLGEPVGAEVDCLVAGEFEETGRDPGCMGDQCVEVMVEDGGDRRIGLSGPMKVVDAAKLIEFLRRQLGDLAIGT